MRRIFFLFAAAALITACSPEMFGWIVPEPEVITHQYDSLDTPILNPERGFFIPYIVPTEKEFSNADETGNTLVYFSIRFDNWRETDLPQDLLDELDANWAVVRLKGLKTIIRFSYNDGFADDARKEIILRHIDQLAPILQKNGDVIAWVEAGFIGAWGEWHASTHGLDNIEDKREILQALLNALPNDRFVQVRYPQNIIEMYPNPIDAANARIGHHNDCFLASDTDMGTYDHNGENTIVNDQLYLAELTRFAPMSGETCTLNPPRSNCNTAIREMELLHFSALNQTYNMDVLNSWEQSGCMKEIANRLGYRFSLTSADFNEEVRPGGLINLTVKFDNTGFGSLVNPRNIILILDGPARYTIPLGIDPRIWAPGQNSFNIKMFIDPTAPEGEYRIALWMPDNAPTLKHDPRYAIRFANAGTWDDKNGFNILGTIRVDPNAIGRVARSNENRVVQVTSEGTIPFPPSTPESYP